MGNVGEDGKLGIRILATVSSSWWNSKHHPVLRDVAMLVLPMSDRGNNIIFRTGAAETTHTHRDNSA